MYWDRKSRPEFRMCGVWFIQWFLTNIIKEKTGDLKFRSEWTGFRFTQCPVSSGFTVYWLWKRKFKKWPSTIPPISTKRSTTSHLKPLSKNKGDVIWYCNSRSLLKNRHQNMAGLKPCKFFETHPKHCQCICCLV